MPITLEGFIEWKEAVGKTIDKIINTQTQTDTQEQSANGAGVSSESVRKTVLQFTDGTSLVIQG